MTPTAHSPSPAVRSPPTWLVGAYAASPSRTGWSPDKERRFLNGVLSLPGVVGLELPFTEALHKHDEDWLFQWLHPGLEIVVTLAPGTMEAVRADPEFGLASSDEGGRRRAVAQVSRASAAIKRLETATCGPVRALQIFSAPRLTSGHSSTAAFVRSLTELCALNLGHTRLVVEHCDAPPAPLPAAKGFLSLADEIQAVQTVNDQTNSSIGISVNWGRSAIEQRSVSGPVQHVTLLREAGLLAGLAFSGCAPVRTEFGAAWADAHLPPAPRHPDQDHHIAMAIDTLEPKSLMTSGELHRTLLAAGPLARTAFLAVKIAARPTATTSGRIRSVAQAMTLVRTSVPAQL